MATTTDYLKLHFIVFLWGFTAILGLLISIPFVEMVFFRTLLAAMGMGIVILYTRDSLKISTGDGIKLILIGFIVSFHWLAFFGSARVSNASVSLVGFATNSLWAAILEPWMNRRRIKKFELLLGLMVIGGLYIIFSFDFEYTYGLILGIAAGFAAALFSVLNAKVVHRINAYTITFYEMVGAFLGTSIFLFINQFLNADSITINLSPTLTDWMYITILALACTVYAFSMAIKLMKTLTVFFIQLTLNLEPVYGIIMALIILGDTEKMGINFYAGTLIILCAVLIYPVLKRKFDKPSFIR